MRKTWFTLCTAAVILIVMVSSAFAADIMEVAMRQNNLKTFVSAVKAAGLTDTLNGTGPFTVFAPSDAAFKKLPKTTLNALLKPENKARLASILKYHVIKGKVTAREAMDMKSGTMVTTVGGSKLKITHSKSGVFINGAKVTMTDIMADNGVIHVINTVLMPSANR